MKRERCRHCDGELEYGAYPKRIDKDGKPSTKEFVTIRTCKKCGKAPYPDVKKEGLPET